MPVARLVAADTQQGFGSRVQLAYDAARGDHGNRGGQTVEDRGRRQGAGEGRGLT